MDELQHVKMSVSALTAMDKIWFVAILCRLLCRCGSHILSVGSILHFMLHVNSYLIF